MINRFKYIKLQDETFDNLQKIKSKLIKYPHKSKLKDKIIMTRRDNKVIPENFSKCLILNKFYELYDIDQLDNFPKSYKVYIKNGLNVCNIKWNYNLVIYKYRDDIKNMDDIYKIMYNVIMSLHSNRMLIMNY